MTPNTNIQNYRFNLRKNLEKNPEDVNSLIHLGALEFECFHNINEATLLLEKAIQIDPLNPKPKFWLAMCFFYDCFQYSNAQKLLKEALELDPKQPECLSLLGWIIRETDGPINEAIQYVQQALLYAPDWPMLRWQIARFFLLIDNVEAAENEVQKAFQIRPLDPHKITNEVERYYEDVVTGRGWKDIVKEFDHILELIQQAKNNRLQESLRRRICLLFQKKF